MVSLGHECSEFLWLVREWVFIVGDDGVMVSGLDN